jgi:hypothetical protein
MPDSAARRYYDRKIADGKAPRATLRCLKRHLSNQLWRTMIADEHRHRDKPNNQSAMAS